jgi:zinc finger-containing ubiquitin peptidase 1
VQQQRLPSESTIIQQHQDQLQELHFQNHRARHGFFGYGSNSDPFTTTATPSSSSFRPGSCHLCGKPGHWARECRHTHDNKSAKERVIKPPIASSIVAAQQRDPSSSSSCCSSFQLINRLAECITNELPSQPTKSQPKQQQFITQQSLLCASPGLVHFASTAYDQGFGCGWRNLQVQVSHLLSTYPQSSSLCGGVGWVPDISSLQAWLECAWEEGFDPPGAEQLEHSVQGSRKWIGTTEVAVVLRYFGMNALIVDFTDKSKFTIGRGGKKGAAGQQNGNNSEEVHLNVECDSCGIKPIVGLRYKSRVLPNYDLCAKCHQNQGGDDGPVAPFQRMMATGMRNTGGGICDYADDSKQQLLRWIWNYFERHIPSSSSSSSENGDNGFGEKETKRLKLVNGGGGTGSHDDGNEKVVVTNAGPLYFQHEGHSRTIIGIEKRRVIGTTTTTINNHNRNQNKKGGSNNNVGSSSSSLPQYQLSLLILDPSIDKRLLQNALERGQGWQQLLRKGAHTLKHSQWQLMYVPPPSLGGVVVSEEEKEKLKKITANERY